MTTYYAICNVHGPISRRIEAESVEDAVNYVSTADTRQWIDEPATDAEDDLDIDGADLSESEMMDAMESAGYVMVRDLASVSVGPAPTRVAHVSDGWMLFGRDQ